MTCTLLSTASPLCRAPRRSPATGGDRQSASRSVVSLSRSSHPNHDHQLTPRSVLSVSFALVILLVIFCSVVIVSVSSASSVFVGPSGLLVDSPLQLQGVDVGDAINALRAELTSLKATVHSQAESIASLQAESASLRSDLTATEATVASQAESIAALAAEVSALNSTVTDISDLTGTTTIVIVVNGLRRLTAAIDATAANQTAALASLSQSLIQVESLTGDSLLVTAIAGLTSTTTSLTSTVDAIGSLTGSSIIVTTVESIVDSMTDLATDISTLQTLETATTQMLTTISTTLTSQVTIINNKIDADDAALQAEISALNATLTAAVTALQAALEVEIIAVNRTLSAELAFVGVALQSELTSLNASLHVAVASVSSAVDFVSSVLAPGLISYFHATSAPPGWLIANGTAVNRTTYPDLFGVISTTYGSGDGWSTFALPDLRAQFIRGLDAGKGIDTSRVLGSSQEATQIGDWIGQNSADAAWIGWLANIEQEVSVACTITYADPSTVADTVTTSQTEEHCATRVHQVLGRQHCNTGAGIRSR